MQFRLFNNMVNKLLFICFKTIHGKNLKINGILHRRGKGELVIGDNVKINSSKNANILGGNHYTTIFVNKGKKITIGNNVGISNSTIICYSKIVIKDNVKIGADTEIYDTDFHSINYEDRKDNKTDIPVSKPVIIDEGAFIGAHSIILKGVTIGKHSVIGAGSVVTKNVPDNEIWCGNPAKFIRKVI